MHMCQGEGLGSRLLGLHTVAWPAYCGAILRAMHSKLGGGGRGHTNLTEINSSGMTHDCQHGRNNNSAAFADRLITLRKT